MTGKAYRENSMKWTAASMPSLQGKIAVVTGANSGLGLHTAIGLAAAGAEVVMACRSPDKAARALQQVRAQAPGAKVEVMPLDLADLASVRAFAQGFKAKHPHLDLLVNNAGVMAVPYAKTRDGFEMQIGTNHFGHFVLTGLLLDALEAAPAARVINVASMAHKWTRGMDLEDVNFERKAYKKWDAYGKSKLANLLFTFELNRRLQQAGVRVIAAAAHPGYSDTNLGFVGPQLENSAFGRLFMQAGNALFAQPSSMGALPTLYAASMPDVHGGDYIGPDGFQQMRGYPTKVGCRAAARNAELQRRWWELSEKLTGVQYL
jgi:NAD(P)-dependent dehydrogenase (short-subunit alcohol dehydrogenase family)